jgi:hypothetical protein
MRNINAQLLRLTYRNETGNEKPVYNLLQEENDYVEWLEEIVSERLEFKEKLNNSKANMKKFSKMSQSEFNKRMDSHFLRYGK